MRTIDADALEDKAKRYSLGYYEEDEWAVPLEAIDEAPTIEPKHGEWIGTQIGHYPCYECSLCHYGVQPWNTTRYCPNCGARMKGADDGKDIQSEAE